MFDIADLPTSSSAHVGPRVLGLRDFYSRFHLFIFIGCGRHRQRCLVFFGSSKSSHRMSLRSQTPFQTFCESVSDLIPSNTKVTRTAFGDFPPTSLPPALSKMKPKNGEGARCANVRKSRKSTLSRPENFVLLQRLKAKSFSTCSDVAAQTSLRFAVPVVAQQVIPRVRGGF